jgi:MHS family proline/betaine transporter-like MFS transporter
LPTHAQIGVTASVLLVAIRIVQGISVAGEYTASGVLIVEEAEKSSRGFVGSWIAFAMMLGCVLGSAVPALLDTVLTDEQTAAWGWRIPFFVGSGVAVFSAILRVHLPESTVITSHLHRVSAPVLEAIKNHWAVI